MYNRYFTVNMNVGINTNDKCKTECRRRRHFNVDNLNPSNVQNWDNNKTSLNKEILNCSFLF